MNRWLEQNRLPVFAAIGLALVAAITGLLLRYQRPAPITIEPPPPTAVPTPTPTPGPILVYISGAVASPEVYALPAGSIVRDAVLAAGGLTGEADPDRINLAQHLNDGDHVHIPRVGEDASAVPLAADAAAGSTDVTPTPSGPININTATQEELEWLPGIGPALAARIIAYREAHGPFTSPEQIQNVSGIGPAKYADIKALIVTE
jgi:competence protein ComEA